MAPEPWLSGGLIDPCASFQFSPCLVCFFLLSKGPAVLSATFSPLLLPHNLESWDTWLPAGCPQQNPPGSTSLLCGTALLLGGPRRAVVAQ